MFRRSLVLVPGLVMTLVSLAPGWAAPGDLDPTFGGDGRVTTDPTPGVDSLNAVVVQPDGKVVAAGDVNSAAEIAVVRYLEDGTPDPDFGGGDGIVTTDVSGAAATDFVQDLALQPDGKLVAVGTAVVGGENVFAIARYLPGGGLDTDFGGGDGIVSPSAPWPS